MDGWMDGLVRDGMVEGLGKRWDGGRIGKRWDGGGIGKRWEAKREEGGRRRKGEVREEKQRGN